MILRMCFCFNKSPIRFPSPSTHQPLFLQDKGEDTDEPRTALSSGLGIPHRVSPCPHQSLQSITQFPQPCQPPTAVPIDTSSLFCPVCLGCRRVTAVPCLITDGLRRCQPMNKITVFLQCKCRQTPRRRLCEVRRLLIGWRRLMRKVVLHFKKH